MIEKITTFKTNYTFVFDILVGLLTALLFSAFIYFEHWGFSFKLLNTLFGLIAIALFLYISKRAILVAGFFTGLLWFYWIGYSFEYTGVGYLTPFVSFGFAIIYMLFFGLLALSKEVYIRALLLFGLSFFEPFDWNWMQIELVFIESFIGIYKYQLILVLLALSLPNYIKKPYKYAPLFLLILAINFNTQELKEPELSIKLISTNISQDKKWKRENLRSTVDLVFREIEDAIEKKHDIVVFPESVFPLYMNNNQLLIDRLLIYSKDISIIVGTLYREDNHNYNVSYFFEDGQFEVAKKLVLVPFGEYIPLPKFAQDYINEMFFAGEADFKTAKEPTDFNIKGVKFRNAICYEATCSELYEGEVRFMIAISNNAWFEPSIEPTIQNLLMRYYARKNNTIIYHSANYKGSGVIK
ncbi:MAG: apolipoprotein N-acyltransferase [Sulfurimonas sp.]|uniref:apolipoprotein N-acyltransferase n=1 Tax=Sulfurimonas sp. TaxID=2022749 RepID=UPI0025FC570E|nr:apolipoprotein N-acyltransferase [Sulfurimonas sp.]MCK9492502.1 apolipoprotein N-acyltransferase [Sulfurimonas sp.]